MLWYDQYGTKINFSFFLSFFLREFHFGGQKKKYYDQYKLICVWHLFVSYWTFNLATHAINSIVNGYSQKKFIVHKGDDR